MPQDNRTFFGSMPDGSPVEIISLHRGPLSCKVLTYGGALQSLTVPDRQGDPVDVLLGFDTLEDYMAQDKYIGALVGRYANRIGGAHFSLNGKDYPLAKNDGSNHLHGGITGFDKQLWTVKALSENTLTLELYSPDGQEGYPGDLTVRVTYTLEETGLTIDDWAKSSRDTICSLTSHAYFNLSDQGSGPVLNQLIQIPARFYTPTDSGSIPTGEIASVEDTPMDLTRALPMGRHIDDDFPQLQMARGYDHNYVLSGPRGSLRPAARAWSPLSGIFLEALTTLPGLQFYTGNFLKGCPAGKGGAPYGNRWGFCLEAQMFPDAPNCAHFPSPMLRKGEIFRHRTVYRFSQSEDDSPFFRPFPSEPFVFSQG